MGGKFSKKWVGENPEKSGLFGQQILGWKGPWATNSRVEGSMVTTRMTWNIFRIGNPKKNTLHLPRWHPGAWVGGRSNVSSTNHYEMMGEKKHRCFKQSSQIFYEDSPIPALSPNMAFSIGATCWSGLKLQSDAIQSWTKINWTFLQ